MEEFGRVLRSLMAQRGFSAQEVARQVPCDPSLISRYGRGRQRPSQRMAGRLDEVLAASGALASLVRPGPGRREVLAGGLLAGSMLAVGADAAQRLGWAARQQRIDMTTVRALADVLAAQRRAEDTLGSAAMLSPVTAQLSVVEDLIRHARGPARPALVDVGQQWAQFAAWLSRDAGEQAAARAHCAQALEWATELGDRSMTATVLVERSYLAAEAGEVGSMIGLAKAAQRDGKAAIEQRALAAGLEARGLAMLGEIGPAERKLGEADCLAERATATPARRPWSYWMTPVFFRNVAGFTCGYLTGAGPRWHTRAVELLSASPRSGDSALWMPAANLTHITFAHARAGDVENACATGLRAVAAARRTGSARHLTTLVGIQAGLTARWSGDARVAALADAFR
jgi:transcriptional regulator with XRE-family HTH domain